MCATQTETLKLECQLYTQYMSLHVLATPTAPFGFKSTQGRVKVFSTITNNRNEKVKYWWVDYNGSPSLSHHGTVQPHTPSSGLWTYGTHPWLITTESGDLITAFIPYIANMHVTVE